MKQNKFFNNTNEAFLYYTECNLATLSFTRMSKTKHSKTEIFRQESICKEMVEFILEHIPKENRDEMVLRRIGCPRLNILLLLAQKEKIEVQPEEPRMNES